MIKYYYPDGSHCYRALHTTMRSITRRMGS